LALITPALFSPPPPHPDGRRGRKTVGERGPAAQQIANFPCPILLTDAGLAHALKDFGERVQYSVFECRLTPKQLDRLRTRVQS